MGAISIFFSVIYIAMAAFGFIIGDFFLVLLGLVGVIFSVFIGIKSNERITK